MKAKELLKGIAGVWQGDPHVDVSGISTDSRAVGAGDAYFALRGAKADGHDYLDGALRAGASLAVVDRSDLAMRGWPAVFVAQDIRGAMAVLGKTLYGDPAQRLKMVGVTGTNGKTSTVYLLREALEHLTWSAASCGTLGLIDPDGQRTTGFTTPDIPILMPWLMRCAEAGVDGVAMEVSSHALQLGRTDAVEFDAAAFTNFSRDHLDFHSDLDDYFFQKAKLFRERLKPKGIAVLNGQDPRISALADELEQLHGEERVLRVVEGETYRVLDESVDGLVCEIAFRTGKMELRSPLIGRYNAYNLCTVALLMEGLGCTSAGIVEALSRVGSIPGRMARVPGREGPAVFVDYAHTPAALEAALGALRGLLTKGGRLVAVFGCGGDRDAGKRPLMGASADRGADRVLVTTDNPRHEDAASIASQVLQGVPAAARADGRVVAVLDRREAIHSAIAGSTPRDIVLIAGKGHETTQILGNDVIEFDDHLVAAEFLREPRQEPPDV